MRRHPDRAVGAKLEGTMAVQLGSSGLTDSEFAESIFGMPDQKLSIRHDAGNTAYPYLDGALLAIRKVGTLVGVHRGPDSVLDL
jgi:4-hydroxy-tetrahydrodipicolinate reductase